MTDRSYREAIDQLAEILNRLDDLIGTYGVQRGQAGWYLTIRARDQLHRLWGDFKRLERVANGTRQERT